MIIGKSDQLFCHHYMVTGILENCQGELEPFHQNLGIVQLF